MGDWRIDWRIDDTNGVGLEGDEGEEREDEIGDEKGFKKVKVSKEASWENPNLHSVRSRAVGVPSIRCATGDIGRLEDDLEERRGVRGYLRNFVVETVVRKVLTPNHVQPTRVFWRGRERDIRIGCGKGVGSGVGFVKRRGHWQFSAPMCFNGYNGASMGRRGVRMEEGRIEDFNVNGKK